MDPSAQYQQQQQQQAVDSQAAYDPSQYQAYDPYYAYHAQYQQQQQYNDQQQQYAAAAYYNQYYANASYPPPQASHPEPSSIHPPGVPVPPQTTFLPGSEQPLAQAHSYYSQPLPGSDPSGQHWENHAGFGAVPPQGGGGPRPSIGRGGGRRGGRPHRGGSRGNFGSRSDSQGGGRGRGRGRGRGGHNSSPALGQPPSQGQWPPPRMAWCELCRVDCNTHEILEQHKNGKRHKKNLQVYEELQNLNKIIVNGQQTESAPGGEQPLVEPKQVEPKQAEPNPEKAPDEAAPAVASSGRGTKRKMKVGRGGKRLRRAGDEPKEAVVPLICELCNVKCESKVVFDAHLAGKKHISNMKRFQGDQNLLGQAALQALYPALEVLYPALQALCQPAAAVAAAAAANAAGPSSFSLQVHGPQEYAGLAGSVDANLESFPQIVEDCKIEGGTHEDVIEKPTKVESDKTASGDDTKKGNGEMEKEKEKEKQKEKGNGEMDKEEEEEEESDKTASGDDTKKGNGEMEKEKEKEKQKEKGNGEMDKEEEEEEGNGEMEKEEEGNGEKEKEKENENVDLEKKGTES